MEISLKPEVITHIGSLVITNTILMMALVSIILVSLAFVGTRSLNIIPKGIQNFLELIIETFYNLCLSISPKHGRVFLPIIATFFLFILTANWLGLVPGLGAFGWLEHTDKGTHLVPFFRSAASDINITISLALISVVLTQYFGLRFKGIYGYFSHYFHNPLHGGIAFIVLGIFIGSFVGFLEVVSEFVKVVSLSFRLFGNVYAGEVVIHTISGLFSYIAPVPFLMLETIVGIVQATVFALLSLVFFSIISNQPAETTSH